MNTSAVSALAEGNALVHMIERVSRDPSIDLTRLEKLMEMHERVVLRNSETAFNDAMMRAQSEMRSIKFDSFNGQTKSRYVSYAAMNHVLKPIYTTHGFALSFNTMPAASAADILVVCDVSNGGTCRRYSVSMPADGKGAKGGEVMTRTHATGSAITYGMRYLLKMIFNVSFGDEPQDDDGNEAGREPTARARVASIAAITNVDQRAAEAERMHDEWSDKAANSLRNAMAAKPKHDENGVIWDETEERPTTPKDEIADDGPTMELLIAAYIDSAREKILNSTDDRALLDWWRAEKDAREILTEAQNNDLFDLCMGKRKELQHSRRIGGR